jgi:poly(3-hydroxybutyrate) depolymerase
VRRAVAIIFLPLLFAALVWCQAYPPGPQVLTFFSRVDDSDQPYGLYLPANYDPSKKYPLVISLHGAYSNHRLNLRRVFGEGNRPSETDGEASRYFPKLPEVDYIVACPFARGTMGYQGIAEKDVYDVLADVKGRFSIDEDRIYLTGLSMGGGGTLWLGLTRPDVWAAIAPVCPAVPAGTDELAPNALDLSVHLFQGDRDPVVPVAVSRQWYKTLIHLDTTVEYVEYPGVRHNSWDYAYKNAAIFDWFAKFRRVDYPERVRFTTRYYKYSSAYWVKLDGLTPGELASIDARFTGGNRLEVRTEKLDGFTLRLAGHPMFSRTRPVDVQIDGQKMKTKPLEAISFSKTGKGWTVAKYVPPAGDKREGLEGPIREAVSDRHIYIYGTSDSPDEQELKRRREEALFAADWPGPRRRLSLSLRAIADKEVTDQDLYRTNLVLFGTKETNSLIARFASRFPIELNAGAADYGLVFIAPVGDTCALVNSGLPWWTGADGAKRLGPPFMQSPYQVLLTFGDFILFKGSLENVIAEGNFDRSWKAPPELARKMKDTGAVRIR